AIVVLILILSSLRPSTKKTELNKDLVQTADNANVHLDLGANQAEPLPPAPKAPVAAPMPDLNALQNNQLNETRLKSPSLVYSANNQTGANTNSSSGGDANTSFARQAADATVVTVSAKQTTNTNYKILQGKLIPAVLETAINSDLPGMTRAIVSEDVYGDTGRVILLPRGTRLVGQYNSTVAMGQTRVMVIWTRAITPRHIDIAIGSLGTDGTGESGLSGQVDDHFWKIFGNSALLSLLGFAGSSTSISSTGNSNLGIYGNPYQAAVVQGFLNNSGSVLQSRVNIQPTIHVAQGSEIQVFVARDLDFSHIKMTYNQ
ncbi:MAG TPA: type IV secretion system protein VirB10, partial [Coxiellaceae bacterium]|nr:type IV secretion system protein VirB10 [Coxiellaceae bacterium]